MTEPSAVSVEESGAHRELTPAVASQDAWNKRALWGLLIVGLVTSLVLGYVHWATYFRPGDSSFCSMGSTFDCDAVAASRWSIFLGVPWAAWGALGYATMIWAAWRRSWLLVPLSVTAAAASLLLLGLSLFVVGSLCSLCELTHVVSWALLVVVLRQRATLSQAKRPRDELLDVLLAPAGAALALALLFPSYWDAFSFKGHPPFATGVTPEGYPWIGATEPGETLHEFVDYACGHCKVHSVRTLRALRRHPELRVVRRHQPRMRCMESLPGSCAHVRMAYCAEQQGKFWQADRWLFAHAKPGLLEPDVEGMARDLKLNEAQLAQCVTAPSTFERARREVKESNRQKVRSVPGYAKDGKRLKPAEVNQLLR